MLLPRLSLAICTIVVSLCIIQTKGEGISCYRCFASQLGYEDSNQLCSQFDGSQRFQVYCPSSTLCMKKTSYFKTQTSIATAVLRDCASQKRREPKYNVTDNKWYKEEEVVKTAYEEGCSIGEIRGVVAPEYCFCSYHLCNNSHSFKPISIYSMCILILSLIVIGHANS